MKLYDLGQSRFLMNLRNVLFLGTHIIYIYIYVFFTLSCCFIKKLPVQSALKEKDDSELLCIAFL